LERRGTGDILEGMRQIGTITTELHAQRLADYLLTQGIRTQIEPADGAFQTNPDLPDYLEAEAAARTLRNAAIARERRLRRNVIDVRSQWTSPSARRPVTMFLIAVSVLVAFLTRFGDTPSEDRIIQKLVICSYQQEGRSITLIPLRSPFSDVRQGEVWRLVTPIFIHFGVMHLFMNMMAMHSLAGVIEMVRGSWRLAAMVLFLAVTSNLTQYFWTGLPNFGGISGVAFGLFGYVWMKSRFQPEMGIRIDPTSITMMLFFMVLCMTGALGGIANAAHISGLLGGIATGIMPVVRRNLFGRRFPPGH
jgi:GlpG protein